MAGGKPRVRTTRAPRRPDPASACPRSGAGRPVPRVLALLAGVLLSAGLILLTGQAGSPAAAPPAPALAAGVSGQQVTLTLFWGDGCPKCEAERRFLGELQRAHPELRVEQYEVWKDTGNRSRFQEAARRHGVDASAVPMTIVQDRAWIGFTDSIRDDIRRTVEGAIRGEPVPKGLYGQTGTGTCTTDEFCPAPEKPRTVVDVPLVGEIELGDDSLIVSTLVIGFVDGINPCSLWVISILLAIVIRTGSRRRVIAIGSVFLFITAAMYAIYMAGIYSALTVIGYLDSLRVIMGLVAGVFGVLAVKDYFWFKRGASLSIPERSKPGIYRRMRDVAGSHNLIPALGATTVLAVAVSLLETPCTAGFPLLWTGLLAANDVGFAASALLFLLYMIPFLIDELVVFVLAVVTMRATKLQEKHGRLLKLVAGTVMLALAVTMVFAPQVMEDLLGATLVFVVAIAVAVVIHLSAVRWSRRQEPTDTAPES